MKRGEIYSAKNIHPNTLINVVVIQKHNDHDTVAVCPVVNEKCESTVSVDINGKEIYIDVKQLYTCNESDLLNKICKISSSIVDDISNACISTILG